MLFIQKYKLTETHENPTSIPISMFPPVSLERPLKLFGKTFRAYTSTGLTFSPDTILRVSYGISLREYIRNEDIQFAQLLDALWRGTTKKNKLSATTRTLIKQKFAKIFATEVLDKLMIGDDSLQSEPWTSDWETILQGVTADDDDAIRPLIERFAKIDRAAYLANLLHAKGGSIEECMELLDEYVAAKNLFKVWQQSVLKLLLPIAQLVDVALQTLVWLELRNQPDSESQLLNFLTAGKTPLGHWLVQIQQSTNCSNLEQLSVKMARLNLTHHDRVVSHDLLRKWSAGQQLMPYSAGKCVLNSAGNSINKDLWGHYFEAARFMSFLCDLLIAGSLDESPSWELVQSELFKRYKELYDYERTKLMPT